MRWLAAGEEEVPASLDWLSPAEAARLDRLRFTKPRTEYLLRRWTGKRAIAAVTGRQPGAQLDLAGLRAIEVRNRPTGAPQGWLDGRPLALEISLSDRAGWAVCLVADGPDDRGGGALGIDLELVEPRSAGFVRDFLTEPEQRYVAGQPDELARHVAANLLWSAKESALKVLQTGLRADTRTVQVAVEHAPDAAGWSPLQVQGRDGRVFPGWWRLDGNFLLTLAAEQPVRPPERLPGSADLAGAVPVHSWLADPVHRPLGGPPGPGR